MRKIGVLKTSIKKFVFRLVFGGFRPTPGTIAFSNFLLQLKNHRYGNKTVWLFYYLNFERNYDVLKTKSSCFLSIKNKKFNDTHKKNSVIQYNSLNLVRCLAASDLFHMFTQSIKSYKFCYLCNVYTLSRTDVWKMCFIELTVKMNDCFFQQVSRQNLGWLLS